MNINLSRDSPKSLNINNNLNETGGNVKISSEYKELDNFDEGIKYMLNNDAKNKTLEEDLYREEPVDNNSLYNESIPDSVDNVDQTPNMSYEDIEQEKAKYLSRLKRLAKNPDIECRRLDSSYSLEEIKGEVFRAEKDRDSLLGLGMYKNGLKFFTSVMETGAEYTLKPNPIQGWSNVIEKSIDNSEYDSVLEELYEIYGGSSVLRPEIRLVCMLGASAFMYAQQKKIADSMRSSMMRGPSDDTDALLARYAKEDDTSSVSSFGSSGKPKTKKRGRPKKN